MGIASRGEEFPTWGTGLNTQNENQFAKTSRRSVSESKVKRGKFARRKYDSKTEGARKGSGDKKARRIWKEYAEVDRLGEHFLQKYTTTTGRLWRGQLLKKENLYQIDTAGANESKPLWKAVVLALKDA